MKNGFLYNRNAARVITALLIAASFLGGGAKSLNKLSSSARDIFYNGVDGDGMGIQRELEHRANYAQNMLTVADRYIKDDPAVKQTAEIREALLKSDGIAAKSDYNQKLTAAVAALYERLGREQLSENDARFRENLYTEINARNARIMNDAYNKEARVYNQRLRVFPASVIKALRLVSELPLF